MGVRLPVIVGYGGLNASGRTAFDLGYQRLIYSSLPESKRKDVLRSLQQMTGKTEERGLLDSTLIRRIDTTLFDAAAVPVNRQSTLNFSAPATFHIRKRDLPNQLPSGWVVIADEGAQLKIEVRESMSALIPDTVPSKVSAAGQLPSGFDPGNCYASRSHPRALAMTVVGASDALRSIGIDWSMINRAVAPDQVAVYAGSGMTQLDENGFGGMMKAASNGKRTTSKQCPLGFGEMIADFINAYLLGSLGATGGMMGACASYLYNLQLAVADIQSGRRRFVVVGGSEAPIVPEVMNGYAAMGALAEDSEIAALDGRETPDLRRACRPFSSNCGFTIAESGQFAVLMDDALAMELGAPIYGAVADVFVNADGFKKSISAPGAGNYLTVARAAALTERLLGAVSLRERSFVHAHGTGTPQNRTTESHVLSEVAKAFGIEKWPVSAIKCFLGHSIGTAGGDQLVATLGAWQTQTLVGIKTIDHIADDVYTEGLDFLLDDREFARGAMDSCLINAKGFGGNNATALVLSPEKALHLLRNKHGQAALTAYEKKTEAARQQAADYREALLTSTPDPIYIFGDNVLGGADIEINTATAHVDGWEKDVLMNQPHPLDEWTR